MRRLTVSIVVVFFALLSACGTPAFDRAIPLPPAADGGTLPFRLRAMAYFPNAQLGRQAIYTDPYGRRFPMSEVEGRAIAVGGAGVFAKLFAEASFNNPAVIPQIVVMLDGTADWTSINGDFLVSASAVILDPSGNPIGRYADRAQTDASSGQSALENAFYGAFHRIAAAVARDAALIQDLRKLEANPTMTVSESFLRSLDLPSSAWTWRDQPQLRP